MPIRRSAIGSSGTGCLDYAIAAPKRRVLGFEMPLATLDGPRGPRSCPSVEKLAGDTELERFGFC
jgi:hypothetical protein